MLQAVYSRDTIKLSLSINDERTAKRISKTLGTVTEPPAQRLYHPTVSRNAT